MRFTLSVTDATGDARGLDLAPDGPRVLVIGTHPDADVVLPEGCGASAFHAELVARGEGWTVRDLASREGTWVLSPAQGDVLLRPGMVLRLGDAEVRVEGEGEPDPMPRGEGIAAIATIAEEEGGEGEARGGGDGEALEQALARERTLLAELERLAVLVFGARARTGEEAPEETFLRLRQEISMRLYEERRLWMTVHGKGRR